MTRRHRKSVPTTWLMTDERVDAAVQLAAAARLPKGRGGIVFRHYRTAAAERRALFLRFRAIARRRRLVLLLAGSARRAMVWGADGWHGPGLGVREERRFFHSVAVHDAREVVESRRMKADAVFLSPLFPTRSHPGGRALGRMRFSALARGMGIPVIALGGVRMSHVRLLPMIRAVGWAAIDGLMG